MTAQGIDPYAPIPVASTRTVEYVKDVLTLPGTDAAHALQFFERVRFEQEIGHPDAEKHAARVAGLRQRLANQPPKAPP